MSLIGLEISVAAVIGAFVIGFTLGNAHGWYKCSALYRQFLKRLGEK